MKTIHKFELNTNGVVQMPSGSTALSVQMQHNKPTIWAMVDTDKEVEEHEFEIFGTGHEIPERTDIKMRRFIDTIQFNGFVFHIFQITKK